MINQWIGTGRITRDLELKYTGTGTAVLSFSIAVERPFKNAQGERETDFIDIVAWRKTAENIAQYFKKGDGIGVVGRIQTRNYENNEGRKVYVTEVVADDFSLLEPKGNTENTGSNSHKGYSNNQANSNNKASQGHTQSGRNSAASDPFADSSEPIDISDDDLPF